jgi:type II secretory pathway component GspD/PulD (secretin)
MAIFTIGRAVGALAVLVGVGLSAAWAQENNRAAPDSAQKTAPVAQPKSETGPSSQRKRLVYFVKHGASQDLAGVLTKHFRGEVDVQVLPDSANGCLLINVAPAVFAEVVKLLEQRDRRPRLISLDLLIAEVASKGEEGAKPGPAEKQLDARDLNGPMEEILAKVDALKKAGRIRFFRRMQLSAAEGRPASVSIGEMKPTVAGINTTAAGLASRNITYRNTGTNVQVTARVPPDGQVLMDLNVEDSRGHVPEDGVPIGKDEKGQPVRAEEMILDKLKTNLSVPSGRAMAVEMVTTSSTSRQKQTFVIVGARIVEP